MYFERYIRYRQVDYELHERLYKFIGKIIIATQKLKACHCKEEDKEFLLHARVMA
jgi:hypothetical protein